MGGLFDIPGVCCYYAAAVSAAKNRANGRAHVALCVLHGHVPRILHLELGVAIHDSGGVQRLDRVGFWRRSDRAVPGLFLLLHQVQAGWYQTCASSITKPANYIYSRTYNSSSINLAQIGGPVPSLIKHV